MAKVPFSKLQASINNQVTKLTYTNRAGEDIAYEVKHYLPLEEKINLIERIVNFSVDDNGFYNPVKVKLFTVVEVLYAYTNLTFTDKMQEDPFKLYDIVISTGIFNDIVQVIADRDWKEIQENVWTIIDNIYKYRNSAMGLLSFVASDYSAVEMDANKIQAMLADSDNLALLKDVVSKLG